MKIKHMIYFFNEKGLDLFLVEALIPGVREHTRWYPVFCAEFLAPKKLPELDYLLMRREFYRFKDYIEVRVEMDYYE